MVGCELCVVTFVHFVLCTVCFVQCVLCTLCKVGCVHCALLTVYCLLCTAPYVDVRRDDYIRDICSLGAKALNIVYCN